MSLIATAKNAFSFPCPYTMINNTLIKVFSPLVLGWNAVFVDAVYFLIQTNFQKVSWYLSYNFDFLPNFLCFKAKYGRHKHVYNGYLVLIWHIWNLEFLSSHFELSVCGRWTINGKYLNMQYYILLTKVFACIFNNIYGSPSQNNSFVTVIVLS